MPIDRRLFLIKASSTAMLSSWQNNALASINTRIINVTDIGADPTGANDSSPAIQAAINRMATTGGTIYFPAGTYRISRTLEWLNTANERKSGLLFLGDGMHSTVLRSTIDSGPLLRVRGTPTQGPFSTTFFWGGGLKQLTLDGSTGSKNDHDALEIQGWWYGEIDQIRIRNFSRHGIRVITDLKANPNPDFTASTMSVKATWIERCGGWGFIDDGGVQGSPAWIWSHVVFVLCGSGGAYVQSSSHSFTKCSFSACGWASEKATPTPPGYGLYLDGAATSTSRQWVEGCEFDNNFEAHIGIRFASVSSFLNNRFIFNDRYNSGKLCPATGVRIGVGDARAAIRNIEFRQSFFRFDKGGDAIGFEWVNTANIQNVAIQRSFFSDNSGGTLNLTRYRGNESKSASQNQYVIED